MNAKEFFELHARVSDLEANLAEKIARLQMTVDHLEKRIHGLTTKKNTGGADA